MQSSKPAASGGFIAELEVEPAPVELVLLPLMGLVLVLLPELVVGVSLRTCLVTLSQHFAELGEAALGEVVLVEVWAAAIPTLPASIAAAINPIPLIRMRISSWLEISPGDCSLSCGGARAVTWEKRKVRGSRSLSIA